MAVDMSADPVPSYLQCVSAVYYTMKDYFSEVGSDFSPQQFFQDLFQYCSCTKTDVALVLILPIVLTLSRYILSKYLFIPVGRYLRLEKDNLAKLPESVWKCLYYSTAWAYCTYILFSYEQHDYFTRPLHIWDDWQPGMEVAPQIYLIYTVQFSFYFHSVYATLFMDHWRKDSIVMIFHHLLTMALIGFSYLSRYHKIGVLVLFLHDIADICLEFTKCNVYMKNRNNKYYAIHDHISNVGFLAFSTVWFVCRMYWFPLKVLYTAGFAIIAHGNYQHPPFYFFFNVLLWILQVLNIYWFMFILSFLYKVATGQVKEVEDLRENEVLEKLSNHTQHKSSPPNGVVKRRGPKKATKQ